MLTRYVSLVLGVLLTSAVLHGQRTPIDPGLSYAEGDEIPTAVFSEPAGRATGSIAFSPRGVLGILQSQTASTKIPAENEDNRARLVYRERRADGSLTNPEVIVDFSSSTYSDNYDAAFLYYDAGGEPLVFTESNSTIVLWQRQNGKWYAFEQSRPSDSLSELYGFLSCMVSTQGPDGSIHFVAYCDDFSAIRVLEAVRSPGGEWTWNIVQQSEGHLNTLDGFDYVDATPFLEPRNLSVAVGPDGVSHIVYSWNRESTPIGGGTIVRSDLLYASGSGQSWSMQTLYSPGSGYGDAGLGASVAVAPDGTVAVAGSWIPRVMTGSPGAAQLFYYVKLPGTTSFQMRTLFTADANYGHGTGLFPRLLFDANSHPHMVFTDHADQHYDGIGAYSFSGQVRYGTASSPGANDWAFQTLASRGGSPAADYQTFDVDLAVGQGGVAVTALNYRWKESELAYFKEYLFRVLQEPETSPLPTSLLDSVAISGSYYESPWLGGFFFSEGGNTVIYTQDLGWVFIEPSGTTAGAWFWSYGMGSWVWASSATGRFYYRSWDGSWIFVQSDPLGSWILTYNDQTWGFLSR